MTTSRPDCINLHTYTNFRVWNENTRKKARKTDDPWELIIPGTKGEVAPYGGEFLLVSTNHALTTRRVLEVAPGAEVTQDAYDGQNIKILPAHLEAVAKALRLRKRRRLSPEEREKASARGRELFRKLRKSTP